jgi:hypothetical protein
MSRHIATNLTAAAIAIILITGAAAGGAALGKQPPVNLTPPGITGTAVVGQSLASAPGTWSGKNLTYRYQWLECDSSGAGCNAISGATGSTYGLPASYLGDTLRVLVTASNRNGSAVATSAATAVVAAAPSPSPPPPPPPPSSTSSTAPAVSSPPAITGAAQQGQTLTASTGTWSGTTPLSYAYQWQRCDSSGASCAPISGASNASYLLASADVASTIRVSVTASNSAGSVTASSAPTGVVSGPPLNSALYAKTDFEPPFSIDPRSTTSWNQAQCWHGLDQGFSFDTLHYFKDPQCWRSTDIVTSGTGTNPTSGSPSDYVTNTIEDATGPNGSTTHVAKVAMPKKNPNACCQQGYIGEAQPDGPTHESSDPDLKDFYVAYWLKFDPDLQNAANRQGSSYWRAFFALKTWTDYRIEINVMNHHPSLGPTWYVQADNGGWKFVGGVTTYWAQDSGDLATPLTVKPDRWMYVEIYMHRATDSTGRFYFGVNGQTVFDHHGPNYGVNNDPIAIFAFNTIYAQNADAQWNEVDDFQVRDLPPCATLPCGPPS